MAERPSFQAPVQMYFGWYAQPLVGPPVLIDRIEEFDALTWSADGTLVALGKGRTGCGLIAVTAP